MISRLVFILCLFPSTVWASDLDVGRWLERPGVKMVAVEFYATWCKPCMAAVPRWKALHEKYRSRGFRLVVVATQDPDGACQNPGWNPDDVVCDDDGKIAASFGTADKLPAAYLWNWRGKLLVQKGHVDEVEKQVEHWMQKSVRVSVEVGDLSANSGTDKASLRDLVRSKIQDYGKIGVVATEEERREIERLKSSGLGVRYDTRAQCEVGVELPPNSLLKVRIAGKASRSRLFLQLFDLESGCLSASSVVDWNQTKAGLSVSEGVAELVHKLRGQVEKPSGAKSEVQFTESVQIQVPRIMLPKADQGSGLKEINLRVERKLEVAEELNEKKSARPEQKAKAWCALANIHEKNAYQLAAQNACKKWLKYSNEYRDQELRLTEDYGILSGYLGLRRKSKKQKKAVLEGFLRAYGRVDHPLVKQVKKIDKALSSGRGAQAVSLVNFYQPKCDNRDPAACRLLGLVYERGSWPLEDSNKSIAEKLYSRSCHTGFGPGCTRLGELYKTNNDGERAKEFLLKGCDNNDFAGCIRLGEIELSDAQEEAALGSFEKACMFDFKDSCSKAVDLQEKIGGSEVKIEVAEKACLRGDSRWCLTAAKAYQQGELGVKPSQRKADDYYQRACDGDIAEGCGKLGMIRSSAKFLEKACRGGESVYCAKAAELMPSEDGKRSAEVLGLGCENQEAKSCMALALAHRNGQGLEKNLGSATKFFERACELGNKEACMESSKSYLSGSGVPQDDDKGVSLLIKACQAGEDSACPRAAELKNKDLEMGGLRKLGLALLGIGAGLGATGGYYGYLGGQQTELIRTGGYETGEDLEAADQAGQDLNTSAIMIGLLGAVVGVVGSQFFLWGGADEYTADSIRKY